MAGYIPNKDSLFLTWGNNFSTLLTADPPRYGLTTADAVLIAAAALDFSTKYNASVDPSTRTPVTIASKDAAKAYARDFYQLYGQQIKLNRGVPDADKISLGLHVDDSNPTVIPPPSTAPLPNFEGTRPGHVIELRGRDSDNPTSRGKPLGVTTLVLLGLVAPVADPTPALDDLRLTGLFGKPIIDVTMDGADAGKKFHYAMAWANAKGDIGPYTNVQTEIIP
jgi:hypothetical protein